MSEPLDQEIRSLRAQFWSARDPEGRAFVPLADAHLRRGDLDEALALVREGVARLPDFSPGRLVAARVARERGDLAAAREHLDYLIGLDPGNAEAWALRSRVRSESGDREGGVEDLRAAVGLDPRNPVFREQLSSMESEPPPASTPPSAPAPPSEPEPSTPPEPAFSPSAESAPVVEPEGLKSSPDPSVRSPAEGGSADAEEEDAGEVLLTRTMGELYARQGLLDRAIEVFEHLTEVTPDDPALVPRLRELRALVRVEAEKAEAEPAVRVPDEEETPPALKEAAVVESAGFEEPTASQASPEAESGVVGSVSPGEGGRPISAYFEDLLAWVPGAVPIASLAPDRPTDAPRGTEPTREFDPSEREDPSS